MREILFRGKRVGNGEWVIGDGIHFPKSFNYKGTCWIDGMHEKANDWVPVIPETVGQFTGETDKNGVKIFEGDILRLGTGEIRYVFFGITTFRHTNYGKYAREFSYKDKGYEVIGNIHDNPELLEECEQ